MKKLISVLLIITISFLLMGCKSLIGRVFFGIDTSPQWQSDKTIEKLATKHNIPSDVNLVMDTTLYFTNLNQSYNEVFKTRQISKSDSSEYFNLLKVRKDDTQPTQFRLFDNTGKEIFKVVNCYIESYPISWNIQGCFDTFPPTIKDKYLNQHYLNLDNLLSSTHRFGDNKRFSLNNLPKTDYYAVVSWNYTFKRPSIKLIKTIQKYFKKNNKNVTILYINNHNALLWQNLDRENRKIINDYYFKQE